jgi:glycogen synthase
MLANRGAESEVKSLRVLMTADSVGGVWQYTVDLVRSLVEGPTEVLVAVLGSAPTEQQRDELRRLPSVTLAERNYALEWEPNSWAAVDASGRWLLELDAQFNSDVVHLNGYAHAALPWRKPVLTIAHSCVYSWWRNVLDAEPDPDWAEYRQRVTAGLLACDAIVAPSAFMAREIAREYGTGGKEVQVIHNFSSRQAAAIGNKEDFFLAAGRVWDPAKNFALLEQIAPRLGWPVKLAGRNNAEISGPVENLTRLGQLSADELADLMARAGVFVHPALYEPFGLSVLDAARCGCCLVLADIPSLRELWDESALFLDPRNPALWVEELNSLTRDAERRRGWGDRARSHAARYTAERTIRAYSNVYASLLGRARQKAEEAA